MRVFDHFNPHSKDVCPICGTNKDSPVVLVSKDGTQKGNTIQAMQVHVECLELRYSDMFLSRPIIYQLLGKDGD